MKKFLLIFISFLFFGFSYSQERLNEFTGSYEELLQEAKTSDKVILLDFWATWCLPCRHMDASIFKDYPTVKELNDNFLFYKVDIDNFDGIELRYMYNITSIPTFVFLNPEGEEIERIKGTTTINSFYNTITSIAEL